MVEPHTKNKFLMMEVMIAVGILIFLGAFAIDRFFPTPQVPVSSGMPTVVGFVPIEVRSQPIDLVAKEPTSFIIFSEKEAGFDLSSLRISGSVTGKGRAEIVLDNGQGQELLIYSNVKKRQGNLITGMSVTDDSKPLPESAKVERLDDSQAWFKITRDEEIQTEGPVTALGDDRIAVSGGFEHTCLDTCYMNMKMQKGLYYTLKVRVDPETEVRINALTYILEV
ncbi:hypothetical protein ACFL3V_03545 [Nanoarchaeota archaeon]